VNSRTRLIVGLVTLALAAALVAAGCDVPSTGGLGQVVGSGATVTKDFDYTGFTRVTVDSGFQVDIDYGETSEVSVTVDDNLVKEHLEVELDGDTLHIGLADLWQYRDVTLRARVVMPRLSGLEVSGASSVVVTRFASGDPLQLTASGSSTVDLAVERVGTITLDVSGASRVEGGAAMDGLTGEVSGGSTIQLGGSAVKLALDASGGSHLGLPDLTAQDADLTLSGGSRGEILVTGRLDAEASGGSRLEYAGDPELGTIDASGGSAVQPAGT
jgi:Putative auto-transporter adhesin, head GIN domain